MLPRIDRVVVSGAVATVDGPRTVETSSWLLGDNEQVLVIDAAHDDAPIRVAVRDRRVVGVACTHAHRNHADRAVALADAVAHRRCSTRRTRACGTRSIPTTGPTGTSRTGRRSP